MFLLVLRLSTLSKALQAAKNRNLGPVKVGGFASASGMHVLMHVEMCDVTVIANSRVLCQGRT